MVNHRKPFCCSFSDYSGHILDGRSIDLAALQQLTNIKQDMMLFHTISHPSRLHDVKFCKSSAGSEEYLLVAAEDKKLSIYKNVTKKDVSPVIIAEMIGHTNRFVKIHERVYQSGSL